MTGKVVIPAAGLGTRLLTVTKEQPKEMLPLFAATANGGMCLKPVLQLIFEQLYEVGFREMSVAVGRGKRSIEDHFTTDAYYIASPNSRGKELEVRASRKSGEVELTDGIETIIEQVCKVYAVPLLEDEMRLDAGTPESYWEVLNLSYQHLTLKHQRA